MRKISLNGTWNLTGNGYDASGQIPGSLYSFLLGNKLIDDPYFRDNEFKIYDLIKHDYTFKRTFNYVRSDAEVYIVFDGLDTLCDVYLNGVLLGSTANMHVRYDFKINDVLRDGENEAKVVCHSFLDYITKKDAEARLYTGTHTIYGFGYIRKAHCMLGWDWGPMLPDFGIWRDVYLIEKNSPVITDFDIKQRFCGDKVYITPCVTTDEDCDIEVTLKTPDGKIENLKAGREFEIKSPKLWYPNGIGEQPLYTATARIMRNGVTEHEVSKRIGLRENKLIREKDKYGESFTHQINGIKFFAMGADYVPQDNIFSRITYERTYTLLKRCKDANFNAIRVWGGGYYPENYFYDICDELGLVVFNDLMFACSLYDPDEKMLESVKTEVIQNVKRIKHHPSLVLISGNNEVESCHLDPDDIITDELKEKNIELFEGVIADIMKDICPEIPYIHTSPITCGHFIDPQNENYGDSHYWEVWHSNKPFTEYRNHYFRYLSEFGFQSFPSEKTVNAFTLPEDRNVFSRVMETHQRNTNANAKIITYLSDTFKYPSEFGTLLYASQLLQAEAMKYGVEHLRRNRGRCMGTLYWQLNDIYPVASWSSIDYYGRLKALHYYAKRFYGGVMISCKETGEKATRKHVILQPDVYDYQTKAQLSVNNDTLSEVKGTVKAYLKRSDNKVLKAYEYEITIPALSVVTLDEIDFNKTDVENNYFAYEFIVNGEVVSEGSVLFTAPKHFNFPDPELSYTVNGNEITVYAKSYARSVEIDSPDSDFVLSDNYFDMTCGSKTVKILDGSPKTIRLRSVYDIK